MIKDKEEVITTHNKVKMINQSLKYMLNNKKNNKLIIKTTNVSLNIKKHNSIFLKTMSNKYQSQIIIKCINQQSKANISIMTIKGHKDIKAINNKSHMKMGKIKSKNFKEMLSQVYQESTLKLK